MRSSRRRLATILGLFAASLFCVALVVVRDVHTGNLDFRYLIWNLFLAWIPFALAVFVYDRWRRRRGGLLLLALGVLWLLFFPNAPYIATDFVHLQHDPLAPYWYDAVTIAAFAWMGVLLGFASLYLMQTVVRQWRGAVAGWIFAFAAIGRRPGPLRIPGGDRGDCPVHGGAELCLLSALQLRGGRPGARRGALIRTGPKDSP
jgi:hypothetical protein